jgi:hypothetical protein
MEIRVMSKLTRRDFLGQSAAAVGALAAGGLLGRAADEPRKLKSAADRVTLGRTGIKTSLLGMGTGSTGVQHSSNQVRLGQEKFNRLVRYAFDKGITYFDTADQYGSHIFLREALRGLPRDLLYIRPRPAPSPRTRPGPTSSASARSWASSTSTRCSCTA